MWFSGVELFISQLYILNYLIYLINYLRRTWLKARGRVSLKWTYPEATAPDHFPWFSWAKPSCLSVLCKDGWVVPELTFLRNSILKTDDHVSFFCRMRKFCLEAQRIFQLFGLNWVICPCPFLRNHRQGAYTAQWLHRPGLLKPSLGGLTRWSWLG